MEPSIRASFSPNAIADAQMANSMIPVGDPFAPKLPDLQQELETRTKAHFPQVEAWQKALDDYARRKAHDQPLPVLDFTLAELIDPAKFLLWPQDLFIPSAADSKQYWWTACPPDHRYMSGWMAGPGSEANLASASDGRLFAFAAARPSDVSLRSQAGVGFLFTPPVALAVYRVQPAMTVFGQYRWNTGIAADFGGTIRLRGFIYTAAWKVSPVDGSLELVRPYGISPMVFDQSFVNQGGIPVTPVTPSWRPGPPATNLILEGGRRYLIGVIAAAFIDNGWTDSQGHPIPSLPPEAIWHVWCSLDCLVSSISIDATTIVFNPLRP